MNKELIEKFIKDYTQVVKNNEKNNTDELEKYYIKELIQALTSVKSESIELINLIKEFGGKIISSNDLHSDLINQARASNRMYVDEDGLGFIWEPPFAGKFPETEEEVKLFERFYPLEIKSDIDFEKSFEEIMEKVSSIKSESAEEMLSNSEILTWFPKTKYYFNILTCMVL